MRFLRAEFVLLIYFSVRCSALGISHYREVREEEEEQPEKKKIIPIVKHSFEQSQEGYKFSFETGNGIHAKQAGYIKNLGDKKEEILVQEGTITYHDEHGHPITLHYIADEHGFQPKGSHLPTPPPIPEEIQKALDAKLLEEDSENTEEQNGYNLYQHSPQYEYEYKNQDEAQQDN